MAVLITRIEEQWKLTKGFQVGILLDLLGKLPADLDIRIASINGEELLETIESNIAKEEGDSADKGYKYLLLKAE